MEELKDEVLLVSFCLRRKKGEVGHTMGGTITLRGLPDMADDVGDLFSKTACESAEDMPTLVSIKIGNFGEPDNLLGRFTQNCKTAKICHNQFHIIRMHRYGTRFRLAETCFPRYELVIVHAV